MDRTDIAIRLFDRAAADYAAKYMDVGRYAAALDRLCTALPPDAGVLEIACGPGNITRYLLDRRPDLRILGTDLSPRMLELARANNPEAAFALLDARDLGRSAATYDGIVCGFGLPYLSPEEADRLIEAAAAVLRPGGLLYLSTMEGDPERSGPQRSSSGEGEALHIQYHRADRLTATLVRHGFTIVDLQRAEYPAPDGSPVIDLMVVAQR
ncbi:MAG: class I SAM-dependent methyltransferase [Bacteroidetes bacterium]|nr:class I SAM-dependent methyltransferase [Bacteroidota bacterium]